MKNQKQIELEAWGVEPLNQMDMLSIGGGEGVVAEFGRLFGDTWCGIKGAAKKVYDAIYEAANTKRTYPEGGGWNII